MEQFSAWFWNEKFWFPEGVSFNDTKPSHGAVYARPRDLYALPAYGVALFFLRAAFERYVANPWGKRILLADEKPKELNGGTHVGNGSVPNGTALKTKKSKKMSKKMRGAIAKIAETSWKSLFHTFSFTFGMCILLQAPWFWDNEHCWIDFPKHELWPSLYYYYMIEGAYYIALLMSIATDVKRKDRGMMIMHHVGTINLIFFSYATNQTRIGSLLMVLHRLADMLLQIAKLLLYCKYKAIANHLFIVFVATFLVTRLYVYPFYVVHTAIIKLTWHFKPYPWYMIGNAIAIALLLLHLLWARIILKMAVKVFAKGPLERDDRSGTDEDSDEDEADNTDKQQSVRSKKEL